MDQSLMAWGIGTTLGLVMVMFWKVVTLSVTVSRLERKLDALVKNAGIDLAAHSRSEIEALARAGKKIEAIKLYRETTGVGLAEAKEAVERMM